MSGSRLQPLRLPFLGIKLTSEALVCPLAQSRLDEFARLAAFGSGEALGFDAGLPGGRDRDFDGLQVAPPT